MRLLIRIQENKSKIQNFWGSLYKSLYEDVDGVWTKESLLKAIDNLEDMFHYRRHMSVIEIRLNELKGKTVLEVGSGAGGHSALFAKYGARMVSADLTFSRAASTNEKFRLLGEDAPDCHSIQSDGERLPFADESFDIVYSNGVLHHTVSTEKAVSEVYRVLKPGGRAVVMLYCKDSWHYWFNMLLCVGLLQGKLLTGKNWLGHATEWGGRNKQTVKNPITRCYTSGEMKKLFAAFDILSLRKSEFYFRLIPKIGKIISRKQLKRMGVHPGGILVYGVPWPIQTPFELKLGPIMGWAWFIDAKKREDS